MNEVLVAHDRDADCIPANIKKNVNIFGVVWTLEEWADIDFTDIHTVPDWYGGFFNYIKTWKLYIPQSVSDWVTIWPVANNATTIAYIESILSITIAETFTSIHNYSQAFYFNSVKRDFTPIHNNILIAFKSS